MDAEIAEKVRSFLSRASPEEKRSFAEYVGIQRDSLTRYEKKRRTIRGQYAKKASEYLRVLAEKDAIPKHVKQVIIKTLAEHVKAMLPLARLVSSERFTAMERQALRDATDNVGILALLTELNRLCGEKARQHIQPKKENGHDAT